MSDKINKKELKRRLEELRQSLKKSKNQQSDRPIASSNKPPLSKKEFFYVLEIKPLLLAVGLTSLMLISLYIVEVKTSYISEISSLISNVLSF